MGICQWIVVILWALNLLIHIAKDGEDMHVDYCATRTGFIIAINFILLYFGGFFN